MAKKKIIIVGWFFVVLIVVSFFAIMLFATFSGEGIASVKLIPGGRGGSQFPIVAIPLLVVLLVLFIFWLGRAFKRHNKVKSPTRRSSGTAQKRAGPYFYVRAHETNRTHSIHI